MKTVQLRHTGCASADVAARTAALLAGQHPATSVLRPSPYDKSTSDRSALCVSFILVDGLQSIRR
jgi:hypothetical protein